MAAGSRSSVRMPRNCADHTLMLEFSTRLGHCGLQNADACVPAHQRRSCTFHSNTAVLTGADIYKPDCISCIRFVQLLVASAVDRGRRLLCGRISAVSRLLVQRHWERTEEVVGVLRAHDWRHCCSCPRGWRQKRGPLFWTRRLLDGSQQYVQCVQYVTILQIFLLLSMIRYCRIQSSAVSKRQDLRWCSFRWSISLSIDYVWKSCIDRVISTPSCSYCIWNRYI